MATEIKYYCQNCNQELSSDDAVCPNCGGIKKHIEVFIEIETGLYGNLPIKLTEPEQKALIRVAKFFQEELREDILVGVSVNLSFPSDIGVTLRWKKN